MWHWFTTTLGEHPEIAIFLALAGGFFIGRLRYRSLTLGPVTGTLLAGVLVGLTADIEIPDLVKTVAFVGFLFALGYNVGPQFFAGLRGDGVKQLVLGVVNCVIGLGVVYLAARLLGYGPGWGAGLLAGGLTQSSVIGVASAAIQELPGVSASQVKELESQIAVGYAVCYLFGTAAAAYFLSSLAPRMMGTRDLAAAAHRLERRLGVSKDPDTAPAYYSVVRRTYRLTGDAVIGRTVSQVESDSVESGHRLLFLRIRRDGEVVDATPGEVLRDGDVVTLAGRRADLIALGVPGGWGEEVDDPGLLDYRVETLSIVVTRRELVGMTIGDAFAAYAPDLFVNRLVRGGKEVPWSDRVVLHRGDELEVQGDRAHMEDSLPRLGYANRNRDETDMGYVGSGIVIGALVGVPTVAVAGADIGLTTSGGALILGLVFGWLRARYPVFGRFPPAANWLMNTGGLCTFVGIVGITAGPGFVSGIGQEGLSLVVAGLVVTLLPMVVSLYLGRYLFGFSTPILLGVVAGANTTTASIGAITEAARSQTPVLGYTVPYAIGNTLLTIWGAIIVALLA
ncbi:aspartate-alanine antiporter [Stackebrandtia albiflava]|uniref:aspartate-alanine antiporter n=1 Tax=Stackebrandtia albiflava TaxID=406432 RepID=UPI001FCED628|nr:aspartate-alanine antiporter [Stackebrandtia albiflava]